MQSTAQSCNVKIRPNVQCRENCRLRASANRAEALCPVDLTHLKLNQNNFLLEGRSWKMEFRVPDMIKKLRP